MEQGNASLNKRAEAQQPINWFQVGCNTCLPSLAYTALTEPVR